MEYPERRIARRAAVTIICAMLVSSALLFIQTPEVSATPDEWTEDEYDDFIDSSLMDNVVIKGSGAGAWIELVKVTSWDNMNPPNSPGRREGFGFAFDSKNNVAILFGGYLFGTGVRNDLWEYEYDTNMWTEIIPDGSVDSPSRRESCRMDYDSVNNVIVLWGGIDGLGVKLVDTWEYDVDLEIWSETSPVPSPPTMGGYALSYDSKYSKILVTGTNEIPPGGLLHLWAYDASTDTWIERTSLDRPSAGHDMAFNGNVMVIQGGAWGVMGEIGYEDTLVYDYGTDSWTVYDYDGDLFTLRPSNRYGNAMVRFFNGVYDVGGRGEFMYLEDFWNFTKNDYDGWVDETPLGPDPRPSGRAEHRIVWDSYHKILILYGGQNSTGRLDDTWILTHKYKSPGWYVSEWNSQPYFDSGMTDAKWLYIYWNQISPPGTLLKFQLQVSNVSDPSMPDPDRTPFCGPGGLTTTYYEIPSEAIWSGLWNRRYIRYKAYLVGTPTDTPEFHNITITYGLNSSVAPYISSTDPADGEDCVPPWMNITVIFSETMYTGSDPSRQLSFTVTPDPGGWSYEWTSTYYINDTMIFGHNDFSIYTLYVLEITHAEDLDGNPLDPSMGAPNLWSFSTAICAPRNLKVIRSPPDIMIQWDAVPGANTYHIYESQDKFVWFWSLLGTVFPPMTQFTHTNAHEDPTTHYYLVRAIIGMNETGNSTMGVKTRLDFEIAVNTNTTDINWISLPYNSIYKNASDIANELTHNKIRVIGKWDPLKQRATTYSYFNGTWKGDDFDINPGDGIFIAGLQQGFSWIITGTDLEILIDLKYSLKHKRTYYWLSIPYTGIYNSASSLVKDIEGSLFALPTRVVEIGKWEPTTQSSIKYYWDGSQWTGTDFSIEPGDGIYFRIKSNFSWPPGLLTPTVP